MLLHQLSSYKDGYKEITFCEICGADTADNLILECVVNYETEELEKKFINIWSDVDKLKPTR